LQEVGDTQKSRDDVDKALKISENNRKLAKLMTKGKLSKKEQEERSTEIKGFNARAGRNAKKGGAIDWESGKDPRAEQAIKKVTTGTEPASEKESKDAQ
jgi:hypothetical protein